MIDDILTVAGGAVELVNKLVDLFRKYDAADEDKYREEVSALFAHIHSEAEIRKRLRGELMPDTDPAPAPEFDPLPDPWAREADTKVEP